LVLFLIQYTRQEKGRLGLNLFLLCFLHLGDLNVNTRHCLAKVGSREICDLHVYNIYCYCYILSKTSELHIHYIVNNSTIWYAGREELHNFSCVLWIEPIIVQVLVTSETTRPLQQPQVNIIDTLNTNVVVLHISIDN